MIQLPASYATGRTNFIVLWGTIVSGIRLVTEVMLFPNWFVFMVSWSLRRLVSLMNNTDTHGGTDFGKVFQLSVTSITKIMLTKFPKSASNRRHFHHQDMLTKLEGRKHAFVCVGVLLCIPSASSAL